MSAPYGVLPVDVGTFNCLRGDPFTLPFLAELDSTGALVNLSTYGSTFTAQLRTSATAASAVSFTVDQSNISGSVNSAATAPRLTLSLTGSVTQTMAASRYVFDVQVTGGSITPLTLYKGALVMAQDVTRA